MPPLFEIYQKRNPEKFSEIFKVVNPPISKHCLDKSWVCASNKSGYFACNPDFVDAFKRSLSDPDLQKGQLQFAMKQFNERIARFKHLGLKTQYGLVSMAVIANNLKRTSNCKPETWLEQCKGTTPESAQVDCMLDKYVAAACRGGHQDGARRRRDEIKAVFRESKDDLFVPPVIHEVEACSNKWGTPSGVHPK